ncbi:hypothetical protein LCGC14_0475360 [marine sediment metagenome]|uniref:Uncharacterized protein n=1 Tax=marine sediment metagenome TaxID=412755 RepID=A0A0F9VJP1_9ZZZZ
MIKGETMSNILLCACGGKCEGVCRENHLDRVRLRGTKEEFVKCPSAYTEEKRRDHFESRK